MKVTEVDPPSPPSGRVCRSGLELHLSDHRENFLCSACSEAQTAEAGQSAEAGHFAVVVSTHSPLVDQPPPTNMLAVRIRRWVARSDCGYSAGSPHFGVVQQWNQGQSRHQPLGEFECPAQRLRLCSEMQDDGDSASGCSGSSHSADVTLEMHDSLLHTQCQTESSSANPVASPNAHLRSPRPPTPSSGQ
jgi:hypothetical protein